MNKKERIKNRFIKLEYEIKDLISSFIYESYTDSKAILSDEITKIAKSKNLFSHFGGRYKTELYINQVDNVIEIDIRTINGKWRLMKYIFHAN